MNDFGPKRPMSEDALCESTDTVKAKRGRPKKKPDYDREKEIEALQQKVIDLFGEPFDDRVERSEAAPSIRKIAKALDTTPLTVRKILVTTGYYSTKHSREVQELYEQGCTIQEIMDQTGLKRASVHGYLPYTKGNYNLPELPLNAERRRVYRRRIAVCERLMREINSPNAEECLWDAIVAFAGYPFVTEKGLPLKYTVQGGLFQGFFHESFHGCCVPIQAQKRSRGADLPEDLGYHDFHESTGLPSYARLHSKSVSLKRMTGNDTINARFLNENSFDFVPVFKIFINTNYLPNVNDMTLFQSGRLKIIPFNRHFEEGEQDQGLKGQFAKPENLSGIFNWCLEGYKKFCQRGLELPQAVTKATEDYKDDSDRIGQFIEAWLEKEDGSELRTAAAYQLYTKWCEENGYSSENQKNFKNAIGVHFKVVRKRPKGGGGQTTLIMDCKFKEVEDGAEDLTVQDAYKPKDSLL